MTMLIVTGIEADVLRCNLRCTCGRQFSENDFSDVDNVVTLKCGGMYAEEKGDGCGAVALVIVFGSDHARELWGEEHAYAEGEEAMYEQPPTNTKVTKEMTQQHLDELERAGRIKRTGEMHDGQPVYVKTEPRTKE